MAGEKRFAKKPWEKNCHQQQLFFAVRKKLKKDNPWFSKRKKKIGMAKKPSRRIPRSVFGAENEQELQQAISGFLVWRNKILPREMRRKTGSAKRKSAAARTRKIAVRKTPAGSPTKILVSKNDLQWQKKPVPEQVRAFWKRFDETETKREEARKKGIAKRFEVSRLSSAEPVAVTPTLLGRVRTFAIPKQLDIFVQHALAINRIGKQTRFEHLELVPTQLWGVQNQNPEKLRVLEQAFPAPNFAHVLKAIEEQRPLPTLSRYGKAFERRMKEKGIFLGTLFLRLDLILNELEQVFGSEGIRIIPRNVLFLDFNHKTNKPVIAVLAP